MQVFKRAGKILLWFFGGSAVLLAILWITVARWLPVVASHYLPKPLQLSFLDPRMAQGQLQIAELSLTAKNCKLVDLQNARLSFFPLHLNIDNVNVSTECISALESDEMASGEPLNIAELIDKIPLFSMVINNINIQPWDDYQGVFGYAVQIKTSLCSLILEEII